MLNLWRTVPLISARTLARVWVRCQPFQLYDYDTVVRWCKVEFELPIAREICNPFTSSGRRVVVEWSCEGSSSRAPLLRHWSVTASLSVHV